MNTQHSSTCSIIPPHILRRMADAADPEARDNARATLEEMNELARDRAMQSLIGDTAGRAPAATPDQPAKHRRVYDAKHLRSLPGTPVLEEGGARSKDAEVNEAYDGSGLTYDFLQRFYKRDSIDGKGLRLDSTVHYGVKFDNAMWDGTQMIYGDGDGTLFNRFTAAVDVIGHELTHGITQYSAALGYTAQSGALNEHISDAFGIMVKQFSLNQTARESDWLIGAGLLAKGVQGKAIRSMAAPGTAYNDPRLGRDPQPAHMRDYVRTNTDNGGVHINSGIPNRAFYLAATTVGGYAWTSVGSIWYRTLTTRVHPRTTFAQFAKGTTSVAGELYGIGSNIQTTVAAAWSQVGITVPRELTLYEWTPASTPPIPTLPLYRNLHH
jgi:Zn-dependent metalloprotease